MLKISDFSKLAQVPTATLRYYDQLGLLKPATVDKFTEYRYYTIEQLPKLNRILALRDLGFSLEEIANQLTDTLSAQQLRDMLEARHASAEREFAEAQERLARVARRLYEIEQEGMPSPYDIVVKAVEPQWVVSMRQSVPRIEQMGFYCGDLHYKLGQWIKQHGIRRLGIPAPQMLNLYHNSEYTETDLDVEAAVVIGKPAHPVRVDETDGPVAINISQLLGSEKMASGIHRGSMETLPLLAQALFMWVGQNDYDIVGPVRELHLAGQEADAVEPIEHIVELQLPIQKA